MAPHLESTWEEYIQHVKFWRNEVKRSLGESITHLEVMSDFNGQPAILGLATAPGDSATNQMIMHTLIPLNSNLPTNDSEERPILELKPLAESPQFGQSVLDQQLQRGKPPPELALHYERLRGQIVTGVTAYAVHTFTGTVLISTASQLIIYKNKELRTIAQWLPQFSSVLNATFCIKNPEFIAFNSGNQLYIDRNNIQVFKSDNSLPHITNGVASFVEQEEFERYDGYWWSPAREELLYERVDEATVTQLSFTLPGSKHNDDQPMRYPLAGTPNAVTRPRLCRWNQDICKFVDLELDAQIEAVVPWIEYVVRMGWTYEGDNVFLLVMNRIQNHMAVLLIPRTMFVTTSCKGQGIGQIQVIYEESTSYWINANNHLYFLPRKVYMNDDQNEQQNIQFICGSERTDKCHLYLQTFDSTNGTFSIPITSGNDWSVIKEAIIRVDLKRSLVFFLSNRPSPLIFSLSVSFISYNSTINCPTECRLLTPVDMGFKFERNDPKLYLNPDVGFVCWLSAVNRLPECRFYRLIYTETDTLPTAVFTHRVGLQMCSPSSGLNTSTWGLPYLHRSPSSIFSHRFIPYTSKNSQHTHYALFLWPANGSDDSHHKKFPVIQAVYAGPSIQLVRNSWQTVSQYLKFLAFGYAVLVVDGRGSANRGVQFEAKIKQQLGSVEIEDQVEGLQVVTEETGLIDLDRVVVIGWSYGGYASLQLLIDYPHIYRASCVGGAVTDWQLYDTAYTERYMGMPQNNVDAYRQTSVIQKIAKLPNQEGRLLIIHGMIDENVHFQHTARLINALVFAQKPHQLLLFPNERHAIRNGEAIEHFHASILAFFGRALSKNQYLEQPQPMTIA